MTPFLIPSEPWACELPALPALPARAVDTPTRSAASATVTRCFIVTPLSMTGHHAPVRRIGHFREARNAPASSPRGDSEAAVSYAVHTAQGSFRNTGPCESCAIWAWVSYPFRGPAHS